MLVSAGVGLKNSLPSSRLQPLAARVPGQLFLPGGIFFGLCTSGKLLLQQGVTQDWGGGSGMEEIHMEVTVFHTLFSEMTYHHFCRELLVTQTNCNIVKEGATQGYEYQEAGITGANCLRNSLLSWRSATRPTFWSQVIHVCFTCKMYTLPLPSQQKYHLIIALT